MAKKTARKRGRKKAARRASRDVASDDVEAPADEAVEPGDLSGLKEGKLYYRIGEVSEITGVKPYVLRYWESEFRLMAPQKSRSKQRLYRQKDIETILAIKRLLYEERYTIAGARKRLRDMGSEARARMIAEIKGEPRPEPAPAVAGSGVPDAYRRVREELLAIRELLVSAEV